MSSIRRKCMKCAIQVLHWPVKKTAHHLFGEEHSFTHRMIVGVAVMLVGVFIASQAHHFEMMAMQMGLDTLGYALHGFGAAPAVEALMKNKD